MPHFLNTKTAGLAYGPDHIILLGLTHHRRNVTLEYLATTPSPKHPDTLTDAVRSLVTLTTSRGWPAVIALPVEHTFRREIRMASGLSSSERDTELRTHLKDYLPTSPPMLCIDHAVIETGKGKFAEDRILLIATQEQTLQESVAPAENAGLVVRIVDIDHYAEERAHTLEPLQTLACSPKVDKTLLKNPSRALRIALGLALRKCPRW